VLSEVAVDDDPFEGLLRMPGAIKAARGVIIPLGDDISMHVTNVYRKTETEGLTPQEMLLLACCSRAEIIRLRELGNSHDYLLRLRANAIADSPRACRVFAARKKDRPRWTLSEYYRGKNSARNQYLRCLSAKQRHELRKIPAGMALVAEANAMCVGSLLGNVIVVSELLEHFFYFMNVAFFGKSLGVPSPDRGAALLIAARTMLGSEALDFDIDSRGTLNRHAERRVRRLVDDQMAFTFGHEYAHHLLGHVEAATHSPLHMFESNAQGAGGTEYSACRYVHDIEHDADIGAITQICNGGDMMARVASAAMTLFVYLDLMHSSFELAPEIDRKISDSHPAPRDRISRLRASLGPELGLASAEIDGALEVSSQFKTWMAEQVVVQRPDLLSFYGSIYFPSQGPAMKRDRLDF